jgi:O-antigen/teichoic acid export membrane protein
MESTFTFTILFSEKGGKKLENGGNRRENSETGFTTVEERLFREVITKLGRDVLNYFPADFIPAVITVLSVIIFTRIFDPSAYGIYAIAIAATSIIATLLVAWIQQSILRFLPEYDRRGESGRFIRNVMALIFAILLILLPISLGIYVYFSEKFINLRTLYLVCVLLVITEVIFRNFITIFQASLSSRRYMKYTILASILKLSLALIYVVLIERNIVGLVLAASIAQFLLFFPMGREIHIGKSLRVKGAILDRVFLRKFFQYGIPMIGWFLGLQILNIADRFIIQFFRGSHEVGIYSPNYSLVTGGVGLIFGPLILAAHPLIVNAWEKGLGNDIKFLISAISRYFILIAFPLIVYFSIYSKYIISILLGESYREGYIIIPIVIVGVALWNFSLYGQKGLELAKKTGILSLVVIICAVFNIFLNIILVPLYGYLGAAISTLLSYLLNAFLIFRTTKPFIEWEIPWMVFIKGIPATALTGIYLAIPYIAGIEINFALLLFMTVSAVPFYIVSLYLFGLLKDYEVLYLKSILGVLKLRKRQ